MKPSLLLPLFCALVCLASAYDGPRRHRKNMIKTNKVNDPVNKKLDFSTIILPLYITNSLREHHGEITIGTPPQKFSVSFDLTNTDFWVPSANCTYSACLKHRRYNSSASCTYESSTKTASFDSVSGYVARDTICVQEVCVPKQSFVQATYEIYGLVYDAFDGLLGLAPVKNSSLGVTSFLYTLLEERNEGFDQTFAFWLNRNYSAALGGELTIGGINQDRFKGPIVWRYLLHDSQWQIQMDNIVTHHWDSVGCSNGCKATLDSMQYLTVGPSVDVRVISERIGVEHLIFPDLDIFGIGDCNARVIASKPDISFVIGGWRFTIKPEDYLMLWEEYDLCISLFFGDENMKNDWRIGKPIMERYYTIYDIGQRRVGFAQAKDVVVDRTTNLPIEAILPNPEKFAAMNNLKKVR